MYISWHTFLQSTSHPFYSRYPSNLSFISTVPYTRYSPAYLSIAFYFIVLMNINPNPAQVAQLQALVASWTSHTTSTSSAPNQPTHAGTDQSNSQASSQPPVTNLYQNPNRHTNIASSGPLSSSVLPSSGHPAPTASNSFHIPLPALATSSGHLAPTSNSFLGHNFNALRPQAVRQAVREANQGRLSSSAEHIPRRPSLQRRGRSRAIHPPALSLPEDSSTRHIQDCVYQDGGIAKVRLDYRIYPEVRQ